MGFKKFIFFFLISLIHNTLLEAQGNRNYVKINSIEIIGLKKTKRSIVLRELSLNEKDSLPDSTINFVLEKAKNRLQRSDLFSSVSLNIKSWNIEQNYIDLEVTVIENLYFILLPDIDLADRNFNVWWSDHHHDLSRINIGARLGWKNFSGKRDVLSFQLLTGYTQKIGLLYEIPYFNKSKSWGVSIESFWSRNKEVNYTTTNDQQQFFRSSEFLFHRQKHTLSLVYRPGYLNRTFLTFSYFKNQLNRPPGDSLMNRYLNPSPQKYLSAQIGWERDKRSHSFFPNDGYFLKFTLNVAGILAHDNYHFSNIQGIAARYFPFNQRWNAECIVKGRIALTANPRPYYNYSAMGYEDDYLRGYERYVIDGSHFVYFKTSIRYLLSENVFQFEKWAMPIPKMRRMPYKIFVSANLDQGWVNNTLYLESNTLPNSWIVGGGISLDCAFYYDKIVSFEFSRNRFKENGFYLHYKLNLR